MHAAQATALGQHYANQLVLIGLALAYLGGMFIFSRSPGADWLWLAHFRYWPHLVVAAVVFWACGRGYGGWAGRLVLLRHYNVWGVGALTGVLLLVTTAFAASWVAFFQQGLPMRFSLASTLFDYIWKPLVWVTCAGLVPAVLAGLWLGYKIGTHLARQ